METALLIGSLLGFVGNPGLQQGHWEKMAARNGQ